MRAGEEGLWSCRHAGPGTYDETARRVSHAELAVAKLLVKEGHHVKSLPEGLGPGRKADFVACGVLVEAKSFRPVSEREGRVPSAQAVANKMLDARGQGAEVVIWAVGSGLREPVVRSGYLLFCQRSMPEGLGRLRSVRVVGEGFDVSFDPAADLRVSRQARQDARVASAGERSLKRPVMGSLRRTGAWAKPAPARTSRRRSATERESPSPRAPRL